MWTGGAVPNPLGRLLTASRAGASAFSKALNPRAIQAKDITVTTIGHASNAPQPDQRALSEVEQFEPVIWRAIEVPAEDAAKDSPLMYAGTQDDRGDQLTGDAHPMLELLRRPAPDVSPVVWRQNIFADLRAAGDWFSYIYRGSNGLPASFARFQPAEITPQPDTTGQRLISAFDWETNNARGLFGRTGFQALRIPVNEMAHIKTRNADGELRGMGALARLRFAIQMTEVMQRWNWGRYAQGIPTQYLVFFNGRFSEGQRELVEQDLRKKMTGPTGDNFWLVEGNGDGQSEFSVQLLPRPSEDELAFLDSDQRLLYRVLLAVGVPPIKVMDLSQASVLANAEIQERLYWEDTIPSLHALFLDFLNEFARRFYFGWGPVFFEYDYSNVRALRESEVEKAQVLTTYRINGVLTGNEVREAIGYDPLPDELMNVPLYNGRELGGPDLTSLFGQPAAGEDDDEGEAADPTDDDEEMDEFPTDEDEDPSEADGEKVIRLRRSKGLEHLVGMIDLAQEKERFDKAVRRKILAMLRASGEQTLDLAGVVGTFDATHPKVFEFLDTQVVELVEEVVTNTNSAVRSAVADGLAQGTSIPGMRRMVQDAFEVRREPWQLDRIARTEVHTAQEGGGHLAADQNGVEFKQWVTARDSRVRGLESDDKADHDGIERAGPIPLGVPYVDPRSGAQLMFPGDRSGARTGADTINCRCASVPDFSHLERSARPGKQKGLDEQWYAKADSAARWERDFARTVKSYLLGMQRRALARFDELAQKGVPNVRAGAN